MIGEIMSRTANIDKIDTKVVIRLILVKEFAVDYASFKYYNMKLQLYWRITSRPLTRVKYKYCSIWVGW